MEDIMKQQRGSIRVKYVPTLNHQRQLRNTIGVANPLVTSGRRKNEGRKPPAYKRFFVL